MTERAGEKLRVAGAFWRGIEAIGLDPAEVLRHARLPPMLVTTPEKALTLEHYMALWHAVDALSDRPAAGIAVATGLDPASLPPAFIAASWARDYREALHIVARFKSLCSPESITVMESDSVATIDVRWPLAGVSAPAALIDATLASLVELGRVNSRHPIKALRVDVRASSGTAARRAYFKSPVRHDQPHDRLLLSSADLDRRLCAANAEMSAMVRPALEAALIAQHAALSICAQVKWQLKRLLPGHVPDIAEIARELGLGARSLQRRIADERTTFRQLLSEARSELVKMYLDRGDVGLGEIAYLVGYEDSNSLHRAFREWEGMSPGRWRIGQ